ncbi:MAG TPA: response regulator [Anaerolineales bacterium]
MNSVKIFLFSADNSLVLSVSGCLKEAGFKVICTPQGIGALDMIHEEKPALVILDHDLPGFNSLAIIRTLRMEGGNGRLPVVLMGTSMRDEDVLIGLETGADLCLVETFHPQVFVARVRSLLRRAEPAKVD